MSLFGSSSSTPSAFGTLGLAPNTASANPSGTALGLGVDPTVYLDEKKRFLEHLNHIRRINQGPDQNDSSGYGLYLVRMPVSITPGEKTYQGFGAEVALHVEHEFTPDFLPTTFRNLVINDVVDQLGPFIHEVLRSGFYDRYLKPLHDAKALRPGLEIQTDQTVGRLLTALSSGKSGPGIPGPDPKSISKFVLNPMGALNGDPTNDLPLLQLTVERLKVLANFLSDGDRDKIKQGIDALLTKQGLDPDFGVNVDSYVCTFIKDHPLLPPSAPLLVDSNGRTFDSVSPLRVFLNGLYKTAQPADVKLLNDFLGIKAGSPEEVVTLRLAGNNDGAGAFEH